MTMVYEMGDLLGESERFPDGPRRTVVDVDLDRLRQERLRQGSFGDNAEAYAADEGGVPRRAVPAAAADAATSGCAARSTASRSCRMTTARLALDCYEAYNIQVSGLEQRMRAIGGGDPARMPTIVIGVSGGLDSTHALIVAAKACDRLGLPRTHILGFTMPGFATSAGTKANAIHLMESLGITWEELDIRPAATQMLADLGHPFGRGEEVYDVTFENVQAGLRTDYLFRAANQRGGIVLGTGDLSELALGWCTYGVGDQMSHYGVNTGVPKTLMQHLIRWVVSSGAVRRAGQRHAARASSTPRSAPSWCPTKEGEKIQSTEDSVGPYALQDFTLFHVLRRGYRPSKIAFLAEHAWADAERGRLAGRLPRGRPARVRPRHHPALDGGLRASGSSPTSSSARPSPTARRSCAGGSLSPRGDWRMPSDAGVARLARRARGERPEELTTRHPTSVPGAPLVGEQGVAQAVDPLARPVQRLPARCGPRAASRPAP